MTIKDGSTSSADTTINGLLGVPFRNWAQVLFNTAYNEGSDSTSWAAKLNYIKQTGSGSSPSFSQLKFNTFQTDSETKIGVLYDSTNLLYYTPDISTEASKYVIIEATSYSGAWTNGTNNVYVMQIGTGKWLVWCSTGTDAVKRAQITYSLFRGVTYAGTITSLVEMFTSITAIKTNHAADVGKQAHNAQMNPSAAGNATYTGTFVNTTTNTACSSWSNLIFVGPTVNHMRWELPSGTVLHTVGGGNSNEMGTDTTADETNNPATCQLETDTSGSGDCSVEVIILCFGDITWATSGSAAFRNKDYLTDHSVPVFTAAGSLTSEGANVSSIVSAGTSATVNNAVATWNSNVNGSNSEVFYLSNDNGSSYQSCTKDTIKRLTGTGSTFKVKWEVTRADMTKLDSISEYAVVYNIGAGSG